MRFVLFLLAAMALAMDVSAQVRLSDFHIGLNAQDPTDSIYLSNLGDETLYLAISVVEVLNPAEDAPDLVEEIDPRTLGLLVSPQRLVLEPGAENRIRLVALDRPEEDRFYKVTVKPVTGALETNEQIGVKVMVGYSAWVWIGAQGGQPDVWGQRDGDRVVLHNRGDTLAELRMGEQCAAGRCEPLETVRILAGDERTIDLPLGAAPVTFRMVWGNQSEDLEF